MAWLYAPDTADSTSELTWRSEDDLKPFVTLSGTCEQRPRSWLGWKRRPWLALLFGTTSTRSMLDRGVTAWISSRRATRASRSASQGSDLGKTTRDICGLPCETSFVRYDQASSSWRMSQATFDWDSIESSVTWPNSGSMRNGRCWARPTSAPHTFEDGYGSSHRVETWPTPAARDEKGGNGAPTKKGSQHLDQLPNYVRHRWLVQQNSPAWTPCPDCDEFLCQIHGMHVWECPCPPIEEWETDPYSSGRQDRSTEKPGIKFTPTLNPRFVEWLMGVPRGWTTATVSGCSATAWSRWQQRMLSELSQIEQGYDCD